MSYSLVQLAPGAYDLLRNGEIIGGAMRNGSRQPYSWTAELLENLPRDRRPAPFQEIEHNFPTLEDLCSWLGASEVKANRRESEPL